ncbi:Type 1 glutamine amidotransferase-like domain-containing protein [Carnobacterium inhibens]|uniref:Type 1 glutamine amidotransferase-like domain-containing protein n=1 Tax=Carnobacterium inhibens TaxID=147709 RepID=UPI00054ED936|nr:Type 1 glutamine amidotransferase-like domain-containing protein [Carnobacterium inhibens]
MTNILLSMFYPKEKWSESLERLLENKKILVLAFSFAEEFIRNSQEWSDKYGAPSGEYYVSMIESFSSYGVPVENIFFANYFEDNPEKLKNEIQSFDILFFPGGAPDELFKRIEEFNLTDKIKKFKGTVIGFSAGAMVQIKDFHLTPDGHYTEYTYHEGLGLIDSFDIEVHFEENDKVMRDSINRCIKETQKPVYAIGDKGAVLVDQGKIITLGDVKKYQ